MIQPIKIEKGKFQEFFIGHSSWYAINGKRYVFFPYVIETLDLVGDECIAHSLDNLPQDYLEIMSKIRNTEHVQCNPNVLSAEEVFKPKE